jgi:hypothetical protein
VAAEEVLSMSDPGEDFGEFMDAIGRVKVAPRYAISRRDEEEAGDNLSFEELSKIFVAEVRALKREIAQLKVEMEALRPQYHREMMGESSPNPIRSIPMAKKAAEKKPKKVKPDPNVVAEIADDVVYRLVTASDVPGGTSAAPFWPNLDVRKLLPKLISPLLEIAAMGTDGTIDVAEAGRIAQIVYEAIQAIRSGG